MEAVVLHKEHNLIGKHLSELGNHQVFIDLLKGVAELARPAVEQNKEFANVSHDYAGVSIKEKIMSDDGAVKLFTVQYFVDHVTVKSVAQIFQATFKGKTAYVLFYRNAELFETAFLKQYGSQEQVFLDNNFIMKVRCVDGAVLFPHTDLSKQHDLQGEVLAMLSQLQDDNQTTNPFDKDYIDFVLSLSNGIGAFAFQENDFVLHQSLLLDVQRIVKHHSEVLGLNKVNHDFSYTEQLLNNLKKLYS